MPLYSDTWSFYKSNASSGAFGAWLPLWVCDCPLEIWLPLWICNCPLDIQLPLWICDCPPGYLTATLGMWLPSRVCDCPLGLMRPTPCCEGLCDKSRDHLAESSCVVACKAARNFKLLGLDGRGGVFVVVFSFDRRRVLLSSVQCSRLCLGFSFQMLEDPLPAPNPGINSRESSKASA